MTRSLLRISVVAMTTLALSLTATSAVAQTTDELINQLCGRTPAPARNAAQLAEAYEKAFEHLLPLMSAQNAGSRYAPQILLQDMPVVPLWDYIGAAGRSAAVDKVVMTWNGLPDYENIVKS